MNKEELYTEHYENNTVMIDEIERREIGFTPWGKTGVPLRNLYFPTIEHLSQDLVRRKRYGVFASISKYQDPLPRQASKRGLISTDLVFDIDQKVEGSRYNWMCEICGVMSEIVDMMTNDLGFPEDDLVIDFSGSKGFHITVDNKQYEPLTKSDRTSLLDYLRAENVDLINLGTSSGGWHKRYTDFLSRIAALMGDEDKANEQRLLSMGVAKKWAKKLGNLLSSPTAREDMKASRLELEAGLEKSLKTLFISKQKERFSPIDTKITADLTRMFRVPGSIHPSTGLVSARLLLSDLSDPDELFEKIKAAGGLDMVTITLTEPKQENSDVVKEWPAGTHTGPRWLAIHLLSV